MERLTERNKHGIAVMRLDLPWGTSMVDRLAAYEDTGLTPAEIATLKAERDAAVRDFMEYTQAWWNDGERFPCEWCEHNDSPYCRSIEKENSGGPCAGEFFRWRGPQKPEQSLAPADQSAGEYAADSALAPA